MVSTYSLVIKLQLQNYTISLTWANKLGESLADSDFFLTFATPIAVKTICDASLAAARGHIYEKDVFERLSL